MKLVPGDISTIGRTSSRNKIEKCPRDVQRFCGYFGRIGFGARTIQEGVGHPRGYYGTQREHVKGGSCIYLQLTACDNLGRCWCVADVVTCIAHLGVQLRAKTCCRERWSLLFSYPVANSGGDRDSPASGSSNAYCFFNRTHCYIRWMFC